MRLVALVLLFFIAGCALQPPASFEPEYDVAIIDGKAVFGHTVKPAPAEDILATSAAMVEFVDQPGLVGKSDYARFRALMRRMVEHEFFIDQYDAAATYGAEETFTRRKGNCVSYTTMFVALAREAQLAAQFQLIRAKPTWDVESGYLIRNNHINVFVDDVFIPGYTEAGITVDFNLVRPEDDADAIEISDQYATSLYYGNLAVDHLHKKDYEQAFAYLKRGILTEPNNLDLWDNLGALYNILGVPELVEQAYLVALQINEHDQTAIAGLARSLEHQGRIDAGQVYAAKAERYQRKNPYYHYALAYQAYNNQLFDEALASVSQAISLKKRSKFYALQAAVAKQLGDDALVKRSMRLQDKYSGRKNVRRSNQQYGFNYY